MFGEIKKCLQYNNFGNGLARISHCAVIWQENYIYSEFSFTLNHEPLVFNLPPEYF